VKAKPFEDKVAGMRVHAVERRRAGVALAEEIARAHRFDRPFALIMADLDLLRDINNSYGHLAGDAVLKGIAEVFRMQLRHYDVPARFGGEEFSILLPETDTEEALEIAERIGDSFSRAWSWFWLGLASGMRAASKRTPVPRAS